MDKERNKHGTTQQRVYDFLLKLEDEGKIEIKKGYSPRAIKLVGYKFVKVEESGN